MIFSKSLVKTCLTPTALLKTPPYVHVLQPYLTYPLRALWHIRPSQSSSTFHDQLLQSSLLAMMRHGVSLVVRTGYRVPQ